MQHSESIIINRPGPEVWALVGDPQSWETWIPDVTEVRIEGGGAPSVGTGLSYARRGKRRDTTIAAFETDRVIEVASSEKNYEFTETIRLSDTFGGTQVTITKGFAPTVWWASVLAILVLPVKGLILGRPLMEELQALKAALEARAS